MTLLSVLIQAKPGGAHIKPQYFRGRGSWISKFEQPGYMASSWTAGVTKWRPAQSSQRSLFLTSLQWCKASRQLVFPILYLERLKVSNLLWAMHLVSIHTGFDPNLLSTPPLGTTVDPQSNINTTYPL